MSKFKAEQEYFYFLIDTHVDAAKKVSTPSIKLVSSWSAIKRIILFSHPKSLMILSRDKSEFVLAMIRAVPLSKTDNLRKLLILQD